MLHINDMTYRIAGRVLFDRATVALNVNHKAGFVGRNGAGKSTLIKLILNELHPDAGSISVRPKAKVACVAQEAPGGETSLIDSVLATDTERASLLAESETATDPNRIAHIHERLTDIDAYTAPTRAAAILSGLGFTEQAQQEPLSSFSGGWRMRVALASTLFADPDLLLLDEPTNHLDLEAAMWLENHLKAWRGTMLIISHDRTFLNAVVGEIIHLEDCRLTRYQGNYDDFERIRRERLELDSKMRTRQIAQRKHLQAFVDRFRYKASKAKQAQSRIKMMERMEPIAAAVEDPTINFDFPKPVPLSPPIITLDEADAGYEPGKPVLSRLNQRIDMEDRIGLLGANGNGKSTLVKILADRLKPMGGIVRKSSKLKVGYFAQHQLEELNLDQTAFEHMQALMPMEPETRVRAHLGKFGFQGQKADVVASNLSGGEKARLVIAIMSREAPQLLLLDEPTNHLDVDSREALIQSLNAYDGAVVMVSHDAHLLETTCDRLWLVADGTVSDYDGDLTEYRKMLLDRKKAERRGAKDGTRPAEDGKVHTGMGAERAEGAAAGTSNGAGGKPVNKPANKKDQRKERAREREQGNALRKAVRDAEKKLETLNAELAEVETALMNPALYDASAEADQERVKIQTQHKQLKDLVAKAEEDWLKASEALEA